MESVAGRTVRTGWRVHTRRRFALGHPSRQRDCGERLAGRNVLSDPTRNLLPARCLPQLEGAHRPAEAPAQGQVDIARVVRNGSQVKRAVVKEVTEDRPQELRLRMIV